MTDGGVAPFARWSPFGPPLSERDPRRHGDGRGGDALDDLTAGSVEPVSAGETTSARRAADRVGSDARQPCCDGRRQTTGTSIGEQVETWFYGIVETATVTPPRLRGGRDGAEGGTIQSRAACRSPVASGASVLGSRDS